MDGLSLFINKSGGILPSRAPLTWFSRPMNRSDASPLPSRPCTQEANPNSVQRQLKLPEHHSVIACLLPPTVVQGRVLRSAVTHCYRGSTFVTFLQCTRCQCILFSLHSKEPSSCFLMMRMHSCLLIVMLLYRCIQWGSVSVHLQCRGIFYILNTTLLLPTG